MESLPSLLIERPLACVGESKEVRRVYYGGGGLLLVLGIIAIVLGWTLIGIILIVLALLSGGWGWYGTRRL